MLLLGLEGRSGRFEEGSLGIGRLEIVDELGKEQELSSEVDLEIQFLKENIFSKKIASLDSIMILVDISIKSE